MSNENLSCLATQAIATASGIGGSMLVSNGASFDSEDPSNAGYGKIGRVIDALADSTILTHKVYSPFPSLAGVTIIGGSPVKWSRFTELSVDVGGSILVYFEA